MSTITAFCKFVNILEAWSNSFPSPCIYEPVLKEGSGKSGAPFTDEGFLVPTLMNMFYEKAPRVVHKLRHPNVGGRGEAQRMI